MCKKKKGPYTVKGIRAFFVLGTIKNETEHLLLLKKVKSYKMSKTAVDYGLKPFENLQTSTATVMVYTNAIFDTRKIFESVKITEIDVPLTKKQGIPDKKKLVAPYGAIVSVQSRTHIRGIDLRKKKKRWCTICQPVKVSPEGEDILIMTVTEHLEHVKGTDMFAIKYFCSKCQKTYDPFELYKINHFLNQITIVVSTGKQPLLNVMMFRDNLKFAGCKEINDAVEGAMILWQDYIFSPKETSNWISYAKGTTFDPSKKQGSSNTYGTDLWRLKKGATNPRFVFETVMKNVDFRIGWAIERPALNLLMNDEKYSNNIFMSQYESTGHTNVNIKMYSRKPKSFTYDCLIIPLDERCAPKFIQLPDIPYKSDKKKKKDANTDKYVTFIAFSSSEIILSGRYDKNMEEMYNFFVQTVFKNRKNIEEKLEDAKEGEIDKIKRRVKSKA
jgi:hypothetical protein